MNNLNALSTNSVVVSNGTMVLNVGACTFNNPLPAPVRTLTMSGGIVTNASPLTIGSNALVTVTGTGRLIANTLSIQAAPSVTTNLCITDGGYVGFLSQPTLFGANNVIYVGGNPARPSVFSGGGAIYFQSAAGQSNNLLLIDQGGIVTNFTSSHLGSGAGANGNRMIITNGGKLFSTVTFAVGDPGSSNNSILVTAGPAGPGMWNAGGGTLSLGNGGAGNSIVVDQGVVTNAVLSIGGAAGGTNNLFMITNGGAVYLSAGSFVGQIESSNTAIIAGGSGCTSLLSGPIWGVGAGTASGNKLIIDGRGAPGSALLTNAILLSIGYGSGSGNLLLVTNGGWVFSSVAPDIGHTAGAANNRIIVTGDQSLWNMGGGSLAIGFIASVTNNSLMIDQGALVTNGGPINVGNFASDAGNALLITNASRLFSAGACTIGATAGATGNTAIVTGGSTWSLGNSTLAVGIAGSTNNALTITQGGIVDKIGTLTLAGALNYVNLRGGTLGVA
ncbi:MAG: hypothetical protein WCL16_14545, partial [bacterium]